MNLVFTDADLKGVEAMIPVDWSSVEAGTKVSFKVNSVQEDDSKNQLVLKCTVLDGTNKDKTCWHRLTMDLKGGPLNEAAIEKLDGKGKAQYFNKQSVKLLLTTWCGMEALKKPGWQMLLVGQEFSAYTHFSTCENRYLNWRRMKGKAGAKPAPGMEIPF
jgi:hypothetical protein